MAVLLVLESTKHIQHILFLIHYRQYRKQEKLLRSGSGFCCWGHEIKDDEAWPIRSYPPWLNQSGFSMCWQMRRWWIDIVELPFDLPFWHHITSLKVWWQLSETAGELVDMSIQLMAAAAAEMYFLKKWDNFGCVNLSSCTQQTVAAAAEVYCLYCSL